MKLEGLRFIDPELNAIKERLYQSMVDDYTASKITLAEIYRDTSISFGGWEESDHILFLKLSSEYRRAGNANMLRQRLQLEMPGKTLRCLTVYSSI